MSTDKKDESEATSLWAELATIYDDVDDSPEEEDGPAIDYRYDGERVQPADGRKERKLLGTLRKLIADVVAGGEITDLELKLSDLFHKIEKAIAQCQSQAEKNPDRATFFSANMIAYNAALDAVEDMDEALDDEGEVLQLRLERGMGEFAAAVGDIDRLVAEEAEEAAEAGTA